MVKSKSTTAFNYGATLKQIHYNTSCVTCVRSFYIHNIHHSTREGRRYDD